jgi:chromosomal replication initiator protein
MQMQIQMNNRISSEVIPGLDQCDLRIAHLKLNRITILNLVAEEFDVYVYAILSPSTSRKVNQARQVAHLFTTLLPGYTLEKIGDKIGGRDHSTVAYSLKTAVGYYDTNPNYRARIDSIRDRLQIAPSTFNLHLNRWRK